MAIISWALFAPLMPLTESLTTTAIKKYSNEVKNKTFPTEKHIFTIKK